MTPSANNFRSAPALWLFLLTAVVGLTVDLWTKHVAFRDLAPLGVVEREGRVVVDGPADTRPVNRFIRGWLHFETMTNQGAVFGSLQGMRWLFVTISAFAIGFIAYLFATSGRQRFYQFVLGLLLGGVLGNLYDRMVLGYVRDMIHIFPGRQIAGRFVFPWIFNIADALLCVGVALILLYSLRGPREAEGPNGTPIAADA